MTINDAIADPEGFFRVARALVEAMNSDQRSDFRRKLFAGYCEECAWELDDGRCGLCCEPRDY